MANKMYSVGDLQSDGSFKKEVEEDDLPIAYILAHRLSLLRHMSYIRVCFRPYEEPSETLVIFFNGVKIYEQR